MKMGSCHRQGDNYLFGLLRWNFIQTVEISGI
jgi:hypothetical protein